MYTLLECSGYEPDECRSLLSWILRDRAVIEDETLRFYWYDRLKALTVKNPHLLLKSLIEDHATVPTELLQRVVEFLEERPVCRDPYVAVQLMDDISRLPVDRNLSRAYALAMRDDGMSRVESTDELCDKVKEEDGELTFALDYFERVLKCDDGNVEGLTEESARELGLHTLRVHQWCKKNRYPSLTDASNERLREIPEFRWFGDKSAIALVWGYLFEYVSRNGANATTRARMALVTRAGACLKEKKWSCGDAMMVLWGIYSILEAETLPNSSGLTFAEVVTATTRSRGIKSRLPIPAFAVDKNTSRGRKVIDTRFKILTLRWIAPFPSEDEVWEKYDPVEASHGPSPHLIKQTAADFKKRVEECESRLSSAAIPRRFVANKAKEGDDQNEEDTTEDSEEEQMRRLQSKEWRALIQFADPEPFDEKLMVTLPRSPNSTSVFDFGGKVSYSGPWPAKEALRALAVSRIANLWANLKTVPEVRVRLNATKTKVFLERPLIGGNPVLPEDSDAEGLNIVTLEQRSLYATKTKQVMMQLSEKSKTDLIKTFVFRRILGMPCLPAKCLLEASSGKIYMTGLQTSPKEYKRCKKTVKRGSALWLFDSSQNRGAIEFVSEALENEEDTRTAVLTWLEGLFGVKSLQDWFDTVIPKGLAPFTIAYDILQENIGAVIDAYVPEYEDVEAENTDTE